MREILFRGKRIENGEWIEDYLIHDECCNTHVPYIGYLTLSDVDVGEVLPETVGQYTGLKDKNGQRIFEGDVVRAVYNGEENIYVVVWDEEELDFKATNGKENYGRNFQYMPCCEEVEIIGNIHDKPELLEVSR